MMVVDLEGRQPGVGVGAFRDAVIGDDREVSSDAQASGPRGLVGPQGGEVRREDDGRRWKRQVEERAKALGINPLASQAAGLVTALQS
mgnify:CR=1 FL=1